MAVKLDTPRPQPSGTVDVPPAAKGDVSKTQKTGPIAKQPPAAPSDSFGAGGVPAASAKGSDAPGQAKGAGALIGRIGGMISGWATGAETTRALHDVTSFLDTNSQEQPTKQARARGMFDELERRYHGSLPGEGYGRLVA